MSEGTDLLNLLEHVFLSFEGNDFPASVLGNAATEAEKSGLVRFADYGFGLFGSFTPIGRLFFRLRVAARRTEIALSNGNIVGARRLAAEMKALL